MNVGILFAGKYFTTNIVGIMSVVKFIPTTYIPTTPVGNSASRIIIPTQNFTSILNKGHILKRHRIDQALSFPGPKSEHDAGEGRQADKTAHL